MLAHGPTGTTHGELWQCADERLELRPELMEEMRW
jgi:hypothetical protein